MAYQNIGSRPRFYVNQIEWKASQGVMGIHDVFRTLPVNMDNSGFDITEGSYNTPNNKNFIALLGHTLSSRESVFALLGAGNKISLSNIVNLGNQGNDIEYLPEYDGFTIATFSTEFSGMGFMTSQNTNIGSIVLGTYYDMPHSPDLNLSLSYEYDGIKEITTKGGNTLTNSYYTKPSPWGNLGAWELGSADSELSRSGRRIWDLSWSFISDSDIFPDVSSSTNYETGEYDVNDVTANTLLYEDTFFSQVIHKTAGLPFIFQPDGDGDTPGSGNNRPDQFAICKLDPSFRFTQVAPNLYNIKLKIKEIW